MSEKKTAWAILLPDPSTNAEPEELITRLVTEHGARLVEMPDSYPPAVPGEDAPLPWAVPVPDPCVGGDLVVVTCQRHPKFTEAVCHFDGPYQEDQTQDLANARLVVQAVNSYDAIRVRLAELDQARKERDEARKLVEALAGGLTVASEVGEPAERMLRETLAVIIDDADALGIVDELEGKTLPEMVADLIKTIRQLSQGFVSIGVERDQARKLAVRFHDIGEHLAGNQGYPVSPFAGRSDLPDNWRELVAAWAEEGG